MAAECRRIAIVSETTGSIGFPTLSRVSAAIQRQVVKDFCPVWGVDATVDAFPSLNDIPVGYWAVVVTMRELGDKAGVHYDDAGQPHAFVEYSESWSIAASHECLEMLVDPWGNRLQGGHLPDADTPRVQFLVEICDPCQDAAFAYSVNDTLVSDFYFPSFFDRVVAPGTRYAQTGAITRPLEVLRGGYLSWNDPATGSWWQVDGDGVRRNLGLLDPMKGTMRQQVNALTESHLAGTRLSRPEVMQRVGAQRQRAKASAIRRGNAIRSAIRPLSTSTPTRTPSMRNSMPINPYELETDLAARIEKLSIAIAADREPPPNAEQVLAVLQRASHQLATTAAHPLGASIGLEYNEDYELALVLSAFAAPGNPLSLGRLTGRDLIGFQKYEDLDTGWLATVWNRITHSKVPFPQPDEAKDLLTTIPDRTSIAMAGDWGTGNASSASIARAMSAMNADYTIHLGDVYYSGTESEETNKFVNLWPAGERGTFTLNSNHEMYAGGHGYFGVALADPRLAGQRGHSFFALTNSNWLVLGLDSGYAATHFYQQGALHDAEVLWMHSLLQGGVGLRTDGTKKNLLILTHHQGLESSGSPSNPLWAQITSVIAGYSAWWYWGHLHNVAVFNPVDYPGGATAKDGIIYGRLLGNGGVPYSSEPKTGAMVWTEDTSAQDPKIPARALNGFAVIGLDGPNIIETFFDENGKQRYQR